MNHLPYPHREGYEDYTIPLLILLDRTHTKTITITDEEVARLDMNRTITTIYDRDTRQTTIYLTDNPAPEPAPTPLIETPDGKVHDYRIQGWGHSFTYYPEHGKPDQFHALIHNQHHPQKGDRVIWRTTYGEAEATITKVKNLGDPADMYKIHGTITGRRAHG